MLLSPRSVRFARRSTARFLLELLEDRAVPTVFYVAPTGSDSNNGLTPTTPVLTLQRVFDAATADTDPTGTEIRVRAGTYAEQVPVTGIRFFDRDNVRMLGGYDTNFVNRVPGTSQYAFLNTPTARPAIRTVNTDFLTIDGFYFAFDGQIGAGGAVTGVNGIQHQGHHLTFTNNTVESPASNTVNLFNYGLSIVANSLQSGHFVSNNIFLANHSGTFQGGGIYLDRSTQPVTDLITFSNNLFTGPQMGRGMIIDTVSHVLVTGNTFTMGATNTTAILVTMTANRPGVRPQVDVTIDNNTIDGSLDVGMGRGIRVSPPLNDPTPNAISTVLIQNNTVTNYAWGIETANAESHVTITGNTVTGNSVAGIFLNSALATSDSLVFRNVISGNGTGIVVGATAAAVTVNNVLSQNSIFGNTLLGIDLGNDGVTLNDPGDADTGPNTLYNFPVIAEARINGGFLQLSGFARPGSVIELFIADPDPTGFGEGQTYLVTRVEGAADDLDATTGSYGPGPVNGLVQGSDTTNRFRFIIPLSALPGVGAGTPLTATATTPNSNTSEFDGLATVTAAPTVTLTGTVFEDVNYGGGPGRSQGASAGVGRPGVTVELYGALGNFVTSTLTDANGVYTFSGIPGETVYFVRVVNGTVTSSRPGGATPGLFAVQTYRTDVALGRTGPLSEVGGSTPSMQDSPANATGANLADIPVKQSVTPVLLGAGVTSVSGLDFGFNFDTIVNVNEAGQGSLRQFILNSNALLNTGLNQDDTRTVIPAGSEASIFMIPGTGVQTISPTSQLDAVTDNATWIDGLIQLGATVNAPLIQLSGTSAGPSSGLTLSGSSNSLIRGLVINRFATHGIVVTGGSNNRVQSNFIGTNTAGTGDLGNGGAGVLIRSGATNNLVGGPSGQRNIIAFNGKGVVVGSSIGDTSVGNVISQNSTFQNDALGIDLADNGVTLNDPGDADSGPNNLYNLPILEAAQIVGGNLVLTGFVRPGATIELFIADPDPTSFGEGRTYLVTRIEGSPDDLDATTGSYGPDPVNGIPQGQDTTNRFRFVIPLSALPGVGAGTLLTATATSPNPSTSEFSGRVAVILAPAPVPVTPVTPVMTSDLVNKGMFLTSTLQPTVFMPTAPQFVNSVARLGVPSLVRSIGVAVGSGPGSVGVARLFDFRTATERVTVVPFGGFLGGVRVAAGDVTGDGIDDLVATMGPGGMPVVVVYDGNTGALVSAFLALPAGVLTGLSVAAGDTNGDGRAEVIVGTGGLPVVAVFNGLTGGLQSAFVAFGGFPVGVNVAAGDVNGDGRADIVAGAESGVPMVFVYDGATNAQLGAFFAFPPGLASGVNVAVADVFGTGRAQVVVTLASGPVPVVATFDPGGTMTGMNLAPVRTDGGLSVSSADINGDGATDLVLGAGHGSAHVSIASGRDFAMLDDFYAFGPFSFSGAFVG